MGWRRCSAGVQRGGCVDLLSAMSFFGAAARDSLRVTGAAEAGHDQSKSAWMMHAIPGAEAGRVVVEGAPAQHMLADARNGIRSRVALFAIAAELVLSGEDGAAVPGLALGRGRSFVRKRIVLVGHP